MEEDRERPILWIRGEDPLRGALRAESSSLRRPVIWEPLARGAASRIAGVEPMVVIVESPSLAAGMRVLYFLRGAVDHQTSSCSFSAKTAAFKRPTGRVASS
jgi:hypothetical protein